MDSNKRKRMDSKKIEQAIRDKVAEFARAKEGSFSVHILFDKNQYQLTIHQKHMGFFNQNKLILKKSFSKSEFLNLNEEQIDSLISDSFTKCEEQPNPGPGMDR